MTDPLDEAFSELNQKLHGGHEAQRAALIGRLAQVPPAGAARAPHTTPLRRWIAAAAALLTIGLPVLWLALSSSASGILWAANPDFQVSAQIQQKPKGLFYAEYKIWKVAGGKSELIAKPSLTVAEGQNATIQIAGGARTVAISQTIAKGAKEALVIVTITQSDNTIEWVSALTVPIER